MRKIFKIFILGFVLTLWILSFFYFFSPASALTASWGVVEWEASDEERIKQWFTNTLVNTWWGVDMVLPYVGMFAWFVVVMAVFYFLWARRRWG